MPTRSAFRCAFTGRGGFARACGCLLLLGTAVSQHPNPIFGALRGKDILSLIPNWRFFAPLPAQHDYRILYRILDDEGEPSRWIPINLIEDRKIRQIIWFPSHRAEKAVFDITTDIVASMNGVVSNVVQHPSYLLLQEFVRKVVRSENDVKAEGFQFGVVEDSGFDDSEEPTLIFASPYTSMSGG